MLWPVLSSWTGCLHSTSLSEQNMPYHTLFILDPRTCRSSPGDRPLELHWLLLSSPHRSMQERDELHDPPPCKRRVTRPSALQETSYTTLLPARNELHNPLPCKRRVTRPFTINIFCNLSVQKLVISRPGRSQGLLYKHLCNSFSDGL